MFVEPKATIRMTDAIRALHEGRPVLLLDDCGRENEGDLVVAAEKISPATMTFLIKEGSGVVCLALPEERLEELCIPMAVPKNTNQFSTPFTVSIEAAHGVTTGVSSTDRTHTISVAMKDDCLPRDLARPGHVFPLAARREGVFKRMGHTEGSVDLMKLAGLKPGAVLCELMNQDGSMTMGQDVEIFAKKHGITVISVDDILFSRIRHDDVMKVSARVKVASDFGVLDIQQCQCVDGTTLHILRPNNTSAQHRARVKTVFAVDVLSHYVDSRIGSLAPDGFLDGLKSLRDGKIDTLVTMSVADLRARQVSSGEHRRLLAWTLRALWHLNIDTLIEPSVELWDIAHNYFDFTRGES